MTVVLYLLGALVAAATVAVIINISVWYGIVNHVVRDADRQRYLDERRYREKWKVK